jgi:hypothetical protein
MSKTITRNNHLVVKPKDANNTEDHLWLLSLLVTLTNNPHNQLPKTVLNNILYPKSITTNSETYEHQLPYICLTAAAVLMIQETVLRMLRAVFFVTYAVSLVLLQSCVSYK